MLLSDLGIGETCNKGRIFASRLCPSAVSEWLIGNIMQQRKSLFTNPLQTEIEELILIRWRTEGSWIFPLYILSFLHDFFVSKKRQIILDKRDAGDHDHGVREICRGWQGGIVFYKIFVLFLFFIFLFFFGNFKLFRTEKFNFAIIMFVQRDYLATMDIAITCLN
jgi:hypothetical protein